MTPATKRPPRPPPPRRTPRNGNPGPTAIHDRPFQITAAGEITPPTSHKPTHFHHPNESTPHSTNAPANLQKRCAQGTVQLPSGIGDEGATARVRSQPGKHPRAN
ncbi:hypothetical protein Ahu01nite_030770 [Winogradskya humida]|uniref:Uncharacterized protein n=1 Tax=Winogradskya humida TaxID=113566 RepID=A0ABQ3ZN20_9ACTN|nr:hypothetical protein Ahu01nite_030770 [Actinoplanes humidus]